MIIRAENKKEAWEKATSIFGNTLILQNVEYGYRTFKPDKEGLVDGYVNEYDDELELIFSSGDSMEIMFPKEESVEDLKHQIAELEAANGVLRKENSELKAQALNHRKTKEQNQTLRRMISTYGKVCDDVRNYIDAVVEFNDFLEKVGNLKRTVDAFKDDD